MAGNVRRHGSRRAALLGTGLRRSAGRRPRDRPGRRRRAHPAARRTAAHRQREPHQPGRARGAGLDAVEQVRRGLPRPALLRRLRGRRPRRGDRHRARQDAVRRRARQPPAALRRQRQPRGVRGVLPARRQGAGDVPAARRAPHARRQGQLLGQVVRAGALHRPRGRRAHRLRPGARPRARAPAEDDRRRRHRLPAPHRLREVPRDRRRGRREALGRRRALHRPRRRPGHPQPGAVRRRRHLHDAQGPARAARRHARLEGGAREGPGQGRLPVPAGRPAHARGRRQGRRAGRGGDPGVPDATPARSSPTPRP